MQELQPPMKYPYRAGTGWGWMRYMDIADANRPTHVYLRRLIVFKTPIFGVYVHWIYAADDDRDPHNHPMAFLSMIIKGGYTELRYWPHTDQASHMVRGMAKVTERVRRLGTIARTTRRNFHQITTLDRTPVVTLLLTGKRSPEGWGFLTEDGYVDQAEYVREKEGRWADERLSFLPET